MLSSCISPPNFSENGPYLAELWRDISFSRWLPYSHKSTSGFQCSDGTRLRLSKSICRPICNEIPQSTAEMPNSDMPNIQLTVETGSWR